MVRWGCLGLPVTIGCPGLPISPRKFIQFQSQLTHSWMKNKRAGLNHAVTSAATYKAKFVQIQRFIQSHKKSRARGGRGKTKKIAGLDSLLDCWCHEQQKTGNETDLASCNCDKLVAKAKKATWSGQVLSGAKLDLRVVHFYQLCSGASGVYVVQIIRGSYVVLPPFKFIICFSF